MGKTFRHNPEDHKRGRDGKYFKARAGSAKSGKLDDYNDVGPGGPREIARRQQRRQLKNQLNSSLYDMEEY
jgi:hypothetical protein